jgi:hypothetical protein
MRSPCLAVLALSLSAATAAPDLNTVLAPSLSRFERRWPQLLAERPDYGVTEIFSNALMLCEAGVHRERLARLFELGAQIQDRNPASPTYGNFRWPRPTTRPWPS